MREAGEDDCIALDRDHDRGREGEKGKDKDGLGVPLKLEGA